MIELTPIEKTVVGQELIRIGMEKRIKEGIEKGKLKGYRKALLSGYGSLLRLRSYSVVSIGFERLIREELFPLSA